MSHDQSQPVPDSQPSPTRPRWPWRDPSRPPDASIVVPVNAKGDLENARRLLADLARYNGPHTFETILVVNNYDGDPAPQVAEYEATGARVLSLPRVERRIGEAIAFSVRLPGVRAAEASWIILFDADCRIPDATALLDWYVARGRSGVGVAYTHVDFYDLLPARSVRVKVRMHHVARWVKRALLRLPTTRGSNYAVRRELMLDLYEAGLLADDLNVGPAAKARGEAIVYSGERSLTVLTSGRMFRAGWLRIVTYFWYRLRYNLRVLPVRSDVSSRTGRDRQSADRYDYTKRT